MANPKQHPWSTEALFSKALLYAGQMEDCSAEDWQFAFWSSLSIEMLARATLANISPALLASLTNWRNIAYALGRPATAKGFKPRSAGTREILSILRELLPDFTEELHDSCVTHISRRNAEVHSGEDVFVGLGTSEWLPKFYASCEVFLRSMDKNLNNFFQDAGNVQSVIAAMRDTAARAVGQDVAVQKKIWNLKNPEDQKTAREQAAAWATRHEGHRVNCPACDSQAILRGTPHGVVTTATNENEVVQKQTMLPSSFECIACGLKISGFSKLSACGLGDAFTTTSIFSPAEFFGLHTDEELAELEARLAEPEFEEDSND